VKRWFVSITGFAILSILTGFATKADPFPLPSSSLFDTAWDDWSFYQAGLTESEQGVFDQLPGVSIYHVDLRIADTLVNVEGKMEVRYTNQESEALHEVLFHLYANLSGHYIDIQTVSVNQQPITPLFDLQDSILCVPLPEPLEPEAQVVIGLAFSIVAPTDGSSHYGLFNYTEDILALSQCLPIIAVYDGVGWRADHPLDYGDLTHADSACYLVRITAPSDLVLAASGIVIESARMDSEQQILFAAGPVREFYLAASPRYTVLTEHVGEITVASYAPVEYATGAGIALKYATEALQIYEHTFGPYPYTEFDVIAASMTAWGMEYPCVIAIGLAAYKDVSAPDPGGSPVDVLEVTIAHEVAHQWFYNVVGNDQIHEPWLDESVVQYATWLYFQERYGSLGYHDFRSWLESRWARVDYAEIPIGLEVGAYSPSGYSSIVYSRGPIFLEALAETMGEEPFRAFFKAYYEQYKWKITSTDGFKALAETYCTCDLTSLFEDWVYGP
jgi:hypothetical protein